MAELVLKLLGILFGVLARTLAPYLRKVKQGKVKEFKNRYWLSALASFILGLITTLLIFPKFEITQTGPGVEGLVKLFCTAFGFGFAWNSLVNETAKWGERGKVNV
jgi:O-antigen/teichoic acid export membrane protein